MKHTYNHINWIFFIAVRFLSKKRHKTSASSFLSILGIGTGVLALTVIIAVMNGFQLSFIENILEISSYYIRVDNLSADNLALTEEFKKNPDVLAAVPFIETQGIINGAIEDGQCAALFRGLTPNTLAEDSGMRSHLQFIQGGFFLEEEDSVLLGAELAARLAVEVGGIVHFLSISNLFPSGSEDEEIGKWFTVRGIFRTDYYEYDSSWGFINLKTAAAIEGRDNDYTVGIKLKNRYHDTAALAYIQQIIDNAGSVSGKNDIAVSSWRNYNKSFFNALRMEKLLMFVLVGLIFIVVALNIYQAQRRTVLERSEEIGLLRAVGAPTFAVRWAFALKGLFIGLIGATGGMALALLIAANIQAFFSLIESIVTLAIQVAYMITRGVLSGGDFAVFSKKIFYIREYTARLIFHEVLFIYLFAVLSAFFAAWFASARMSNIKPAEILRYE